MAATIADLDTAIAALRAKVDTLQPCPPPIATDVQPQVDAVNAISAEITTKFP